MKKQILDVEKFHVKFQSPHNEKPSLIKEDRYNLRYNLIKEELEEYMEACKEGDLVEIADALGDILYVTFGTIVEHGFQDKMEDIFQEIQDSNMSKLNENGDPIFREDGKILKGNNYFKPDIKKILEK